MGSNRATKPAGLDSSFQSLDFKPFELESQGSDVFARAINIAKEPATRYKPYLVGLKGAERTTRRLGLHYLRMPYFTRDVWVSNAKNMYELFSSIKDGNDGNFRTRNPEIQLSDTFNVADTDKAQAAGHAHYQAHALYDISYLMLLAVQALSFGRLEGFSISPKSTSFLKFSVINSMMTRVRGIPINRTYIESCLKQMHILADRNDKSLMMAYPVWMPYGLSHFMDIPVNDKTAASTFDLRNFRHLTLEELHPASYTKAMMYMGDTRPASAAVSAQFLEASATYKAEPARLGITRIAAEEANYYKSGTGNFIEHFLDLIATQIELIISRYGQANELNLLSSQNRIADFWAQQGIFDSRFKAEDLSKWVDMATSSVVDFEDYAKKNWGHYTRGYTPALLSSYGATATTVTYSDVAGTLSANQVTTRDRLRHPNGLAKFLAPATSKLDVSAKELIRQDFNSILHTASDTTWAQYYPFAALSVPYHESYVNPEDVRELRNLRYDDFSKMKRAVEAVATGSFVNFDEDIAKSILVTHAADDDASDAVGIRRGQIIRHVMENLLSTTIRYIGKSTAGKFLKDVQQVSQNSYYIRELADRGIFQLIPIVTDVIDQYDPFQQGVFEVLDMSAEALAVAEPCTPLELLARTEFDPEFDADGDETTAVLNLAKAALSTVTAVSYDNANILSEAEQGGALLRAAAGATMVFIGDMFNAPLQQHLVRSDISRMVTHKENDVVTYAGFPTTYLPILPYRQPSHVDSMSMLMAAAAKTLAKVSASTYVALKDNMSATLRSLTFNNDTGVITYDPTKDDSWGSSAAALELKPNAYWFLHMLGMNWPSILRQSSEYSDGLYFAFKEAEAMSFPTIPAIQGVNEGSSTSTAIEAGIQRPPKVKRDFKGKDSKRSSFNSRDDKKPSAYPSLKTARGQDSVIGDFPETKVSLPDPESSSSYGKRDVKKKLGKMEDSIEPEEDDEKSKSKFTGKKKRRR